MIAVICGLEFATASVNIDNQGTVRFRGSFSDDDDSVHEHNIDFIVQQGIIPRCVSDRFHPFRAVTRAQMQALIDRTVTYLYPLSSILDFQDEDDLLCAAGEVSESDRFVSRADAAEMLVTAFEHLSASQQSQGVFADTSDLPELAVRAVEGLHATGVVEGCATNPLLFCPSKKVTRAQTASLLARAIQTSQPTIGLILNEQESAKGYALFAFSQSVYLIDDLGRKVHAWTVDDECLIAKLLDNGNIMCLQLRSTPEMIVEIDQSGNIVWQYAFPDMHHDFLKLPNGNVLLLLSYIKSYEEAVAAGADEECVPSGGVKVDYLLEVKPTGVYSGEVVWEWHIWDHLIQDRDSDKPNYGIIAEHPERIDVNYFKCFTQVPNQVLNWTHTNSLDYNPASNQIMLSVRKFNELWVIDRGSTTEQSAGKKGDIIYRLGNPHAYRAGGLEDRQFYRQHNAHWIPTIYPGAGHILIFNNGHGERAYSSIDEIMLPPFSDDLVGDQTSRSAQVIWSYKAEEPSEFYQPWQSGAQRMTNGNTFITASHTGTLFQVSPTGKIIWKYINPVTIWGIMAQGVENLELENEIYRATWYPPDHPGLRNMDLTPEGPIELYR